MAKVSDFVFATGFRRVNRVGAQASLSAYEPILPDGYKIDDKGTAWGPDRNPKTIVAAPAYDYDPAEYLRSLGHKIDG